MGHRLYVSLSLVLGVMGCGRNPGAQTRPYPIPGIEKIEAQIARSRPTCMAAEYSKLKGMSVTVGKEHFASGNGGRFKLESYVVSQVIDRADHLVLSSVFRITEFQENIISASGEKAPRLEVEASCLDLKGEALELQVSPVSEIDAGKGVILKVQPLKINASGEGEMKAMTLNTLATRSLFSLAKTPEAAILLGTEYVSTFKTLKFIVDDSESKVLKVSGEFMGIDASFSRKLIRVEAVYSWEAS